MDDSCAVCAETLEWVAYGPCGHREVCSTCVARLRFICDDRRCCICKAQSSVVFVTKALGDYTRMINDFAALPSELREGQVKSYWYHEDTQALFDDMDQYKMIKAMCRLSCSVCDGIDEQPKDGAKRKGRFRNIEQLKGHLFHRHKLFMCSLCLEGRKVFICEQKLYTRAQLNQHVCTGDSEVDGSDSERGGFSGHPMCEFCRDPFYGDNELYSHMSTEHYTCHICQRQHPGQYEYYKNYDDLEIHFRREHFLCEDEACLSKKFIVFQSEAEMKRHNTIEHGGRMSRSKRSAALQLPTSFRYQRFNEQDRRRGRGQTFRRDYNGNQSRAPIETNLVAATSEGPFPELSAPSSSTPAISDHGEASEIDPIVQPYDLSAASDNERNPRYLQALSHHSRNQPLRESSFPPLSTAQASSQQQDKQDSERLPNNTMAAHLRRQNNRNVTVPNSVQERHGITANGANRLFGPLNSDFPPVSATQTHKLPPENHAVPAIEDVRTANKSLVERMHAALEFDEDKYASFRNVSGEYRQGSISTEDYLACVQQYGLSHLVHDLATLLPDAEKQKELVEAYHAGLQSRSLRGSVSGNGNKGSKKGKGKQRVDVTDRSRPSDALADGVLRTVRELQLNNPSPEAEVEVLSKDGYRPGAGKSKGPGAAFDQNLGLGIGGGKQRKKTSKFLRARLGDGSVEALLDPKSSSGPDSNPDPSEMAGSNNEPTQAFPVRGVWRNGGGQRLMGSAPRDARR